MADTTGTATAPSPPVTQPAGPVSPTGDTAAGTSGQLTGTPQTPEWAKDLPADLQKTAAKFKTPADAIKSYAELEKKLGTGTPAPKPGEGQGLSIDPSKAELPDDATVDHVLERAGLKKDEVAAAFTKEGKLSDEQYAALKKQGYPRTLVDGFLRLDAEHARATEAQMRQQAVQVAGGAEKLDAAMAWGAANLQKGDLDWYNAQVGNPATAAKGVEWLITKHRDATGATGTRPLIQGGAAPSGAAAFASRAEMTSAMGDARYGVDSDYTASVRRKLMVTDTNTLR